MEKSLALSAVNQWEEALSVINSGIERALIEKEEQWLVRFFNNAAIIYEQRGDFQNAVKCYRRSLKYIKEDPYLYLAVGQLYKKLGNKRVSRQYLQSCAKLAAVKNELDLLQLLKDQGY